MYINGSSSFFALEPHADAKWAGEAHTYPFFSSQEGEGEKERSDDVLPITAHNPTKQPLRPTL